MMKYMIAEIMKVKATFFIKLLIIAPLIMVVYAFISKSGITELGEQTMQGIYVAMSFNWWPLIMIPMGVVILTLLEHNYEKRAGDYRFILSTSVNRTKVWIAKTIVVSVAMLATTVLFGICVSSVLIFLYHDASLIPKVMLTSILLGISCCALVPLQLFIVHRTNAAISILVGLIGLLSGAIAAQQDWWFLHPWAISLRIVSPLLSIHPNGTMIIDEANPLLDPLSIPQGICMALIVFALATALGSRWFSRKEA